MPATPPFAGGPAHRVLAPRPVTALRPGFAAEPAIRAGLRAVRDASLAFDLMIYPHQIDEAEALVRADPDLVFVLDHCGSPIDRSPEGMAFRRAGLHRLAALPNLRLKISNPFAYDQGWTPASIGAVLDAGLAAFEPGRRLFATDAPISARWIAGDALVGPSLDDPAGLSPDERRAACRGRR